MAEAVVSTILEQLASVLWQQTEQKVRLVVGVDEEVNNLTRKFKAIQCVLEDAECRQVKETAVRDWLEKLKEVSYDIEDVLDEWNTAIQKRGIMEADAENASMLVRMVCSLISCLGFFSRQVIRHDIAKKIQDLNKTLDVIARERNMFHFSSNKGITEVDRQLTSSVVDITKIQGRYHVKEEIKNLLLSESSEGPTSLPIISIVGMGGIGKTTLARLVFNDDEVNGFFDETIWVCVSEPVDKIRIAKAILENLIKKKPDVNEYETLLQNIKELIKDRKFLLVLDDVWNWEPDKWEELVDCLKHGSSQSQILVSTRKENVAKLMESTHIISLETLSDQGSWSLFSQVAFFGRTEGERQKFEDTGRKIVKKCKGLPLAIKSLGSLLRFKNTIEEWQCVLNSEMWELEQVEQGIFPPLLLSYFDLPSELKTCFLYCATFPKDYGIEKELLINLWMAHAYIKPKQNKDMELVGEEYLEMLAMRSFFQDFKRDVNERIIKCKMHDMVHDLAQYLTKNECYSVNVDNMEGFILSSTYRKARHAMIVLKKEASFPISNFDKNRLRSLLLEGGNWPLDELFDNYSSLRALNLSDMSINDVPSGIDKLIHLRYLNISENDIQEIPEAMCKLYNLQTLDISMCENLNKLPEGIGKLVNLRHLINFGSFEDCRYMPEGIKRLTSLRTLDKVVVSGDEKACKFECLRNLIHLEGSLGIKCCEVSVGMINEAELNRTRLTWFSLELSSDVSNEETLEDFHPPLNLDDLTLCGYGSDNRLSLNWLMSLAKLKSLSLEDWSGLESLCLWKLPCLESLSISFIDYLKRLGDEFLGMGSDDMTSSSSSSSVALFPNLQSLKFYEMREWEEWDSGSCGRGGEDIKIMPSLRSLDIECCPTLKILPDYLLQSTTLEKFRMFGCPILKRRYRVEKTENWVRGSGMPRIRIYENPETSSASVADNKNYIF